jgi:hypothetical protein
LDQPDDVGCAAQVIYTESAGRQSFELFEMDEVSSHFVRAELIEKAEHTAEQNSVLTAALPHLFA